LFCTKFDAEPYQTEIHNPDVSANEIIENIEAGLNSFKEIMETINGDSK